MVISNLVLLQLDNVNMPLFSLTGPAEHAVGRSVIYSLNASITHPYVNVRDKYTTLFQPSSVHAFLVEVHALVAVVPLRGDRAIFAECHQPCGNPLKCSAKARR